MHVMLVIILSCVSSQAKVRNLVLVLLELISKGQLAKIMPPLPLEMESWKIMALYCSCIQEKWTKYF